MANGRDDVTGNTNRYQYHPSYLWCGHGAADTHNQGAVGDCSHTGCAYWTWSGVNITWDLPCHFFINFFIEQPNHWSVDLSCSPCKEVSSPKIRRFFTAQALSVTGSSSFPSTSPAAPHVGCFTWPEPLSWAFRIIWLLRGCPSMFLEEAGLYAALRNLKELRATSV